MTATLIHDRIEINPEVLAGKAVIKGTRIAVDYILELLANDWPHKKILENYPQIEKADILAVLDYARKTVKEEQIHPVDF